MLGRDSSVGTATRYELDGTRIECLVGADFPHRPWDPPSLLYNGYRVCLPGIKRPGRGVNRPPQSSAEVKERVEVYLYSPSGLLWHVLWQNLPFTFYNITTLCRRQPRHTQPRWPFIYRAVHFPTITEHEILKRILQQLYKSFRSNSMLKLTGWGGKIYRWRAESYCM